MMLTKREAKAAGKRAGHAAATWMFDGNTTDAHMLHVALSVLAGDPDVTAPEWLSGGWAGESMNELLDLNGDEDPDRVDEIAEVYGVAADDAFWAQLGKEIPRRIWAKARKINESSSRTSAHGMMRESGYDKNPPSRQDFEVIADALSELPATVTKMQAVLTVAKALEKTNSRFNTMKFVQRAGR